MTDLETLYEREADAVRKVVEKEAKGGVDINGRMDLYDIQQEIKRVKRMVKV